MWIAEFAEFGPPDRVIRLVERADPGAPGRDEVVIAAEFAPVNPADLLNLEGHYGAAPPKLPQTPGAEGVGRVTECGADVVHVRPGDRVLLPGPGTWRERFRTAARNVFALPSGVDPVQLAMLRVNPPTADLMLRSFVAVQAGHWVIQNAANSAVGHCLIRLAKATGARSVNVVRRAELIEPLLAYGADAVLLDGPDLDARVRDTVGGGTLQLAIDAVGGAATQRLARCVQDDGVVVNYGLLSGEPCRIDGRETVFRNITLRGFWLRRWFGVTPPEQIAETYRRLAGRVADGTLRVDVEQVYPLREIAQALAHAARGGRSGKILLEFGGS